MPDRESLPMTLDVAVNEPPRRGLLCNADRVWTELTCVPPAAPRPNKPLRTVSLRQGSGRQCSGRFAQAGNIVDRPLKAAVQVREITVTEGDDVDAGEAPLVSKQPTDSHVWILNGDVPAFGRRPVQRRSESSRAR
jgi:hypothetical protein